MKLLNSQDGFFTSTRTGSPKDMKAKFCAEKQIIEQAMQMWEPIGFCDTPALIY